MVRWSSWNFMEETFLAALGGHDRRKNASQQKNELLVEPRNLCMRSSHSHIYLSDTLEILERLICNRLLPFIDFADGLSEQQYKFRRDR